jgi:hypothetical protein
LPEVRERVVGSNIEPELEERELDRDRVAA